MTYQYATAAFGPEDEWFDGPTVVVVARGSHDCSRLIQALAHGNSEQHDLSRRIAASLNRTPLGRRVTTLLKRHGGEDLTNVTEEATA
jgi:hypothetical protein